jgi:hypothetical protein
LRSENPKSLWPFLENSRFPEIPAGDWVRSALDGGACSGIRHALAIIYSPEYLAQNEDGVKGDFPRVPLPADVAALRNSAALGSRLAELLHPNQDIAGVTRGTVALGLRALGPLIRRLASRGQSIFA